MPDAPAPTELKAPMADRVTETVDLIAAFHKAHADGPCG